jgi:hypothetical protein
MKINVTGGIAPCMLNLGGDQLQSQATLVPMGTPRSPLARKLGYRRGPSRRY